MYVYTLRTLHSASTHSLSIPPLESMKLLGFLSRPTTPRTRTRRPAASSHTRHMLVRHKSAMPVVTRPPRSGDTSFPALRIGAASSQSLLPLATTVTAMSGNIPADCDVGRQYTILPFGQCTQTQPDASDQIHLKVDHIKNLVRECLEQISDRYKELHIYFINNNCSSIVFAF